MIKLKSQQINSFASMFSLKIDDLVILCYERHMFLKIKSWKNKSILCESFVHFDI